MKNYINKIDFPQWPQFDDKEREYLIEVLESGRWWRNSGKKVIEFEDKFARFHECKYCLGVTNGTHALELALTAVGVKAGDEVIVPAVSFISTVTAVLYCNAIPVLVDIYTDTFCIMPEKIENAITAKTKAVIPVHMAGQACEMDKICEIAKKYGIKVIEDAAHGHGGEWKKKRIGSYGDAAIFSFQNGKIMTCGEGGAIVTNDSDIYEKAFLIHGVGRPKGDIKYQHLLLGSNYRMSEFQAAILLAQLDRLDNMNLVREENARYLDSILSQVSGIIPQGRRADANIITHYMYMFYYEKHFFGNISREEFVCALNEEGVPAFICFPVMSQVEFFLNKDFADRVSINNMGDEKQLSNSYKIAEEVVWIPHYTLLGNKSNLDEIKNVIVKLQKKLKKQEEWNVSNI